MERRCTVLRDRLAAFPVDLDVRDQALAAYQVVERVRRDTAALLADRTFGEPTLLTSHLQLYKRWNELATLVESYPLPFIERYAQSDRWLTRLCRRLAEQVRWPTPPPLVAAFSAQYYWTVAGFGLVCVPATEGTTLLGLPDLCHELGHILLLHHKDALVGDFIQRDLADYIQEELRRVDAQQRPPEYRQLYVRLFAQWQDEWSQEFLSDMVATYLVGPAFGWQHLRLCAGRSRDAYRPALGDERSTHPADEARLRGVVAVLRRMGASEPARQVTAVWDRYLAVSGESRPTEYDVCYPQALIESLARRTVDGCRALGVRGFDQVNDPPRDIPSLLGEAWTRFLNDPVGYGDWERVQLDDLSHEFG